MSEPLKLDSIQVKRGTADDLIKANPVLKSGEFGYDTTNKVLKMGDGVTDWNHLTGQGSLIQEAPMDGKVYVRCNGDWGELEGKNVLMPIKPGDLPMVKEPTFELYDRETHGLGDVFLSCNMGRYSTSTHTNIAYVDSIDKLVLVGYQIANAASSPQNQIMLSDDGVDWAPSGVYLNYAQIGQYGSGMKYIKEKNLLVIFSYGNAAGNCGGILYCHPEKDESSNVKLDFKFIQLPKPSAWSTSSYRVWDMTWVEAFGAYYACGTKNITWKLHESDGTLSATALNWSASYNGDLHVIMWNDRKEALYAFSRNWSKSQSSTKYYPVSVSVNGTQFVPKEQSTVVPKDISFQNVIYSPSLGVFFGSAQLKEGSTYTYNIYVSADGINWEKRTEDGVFTTYPYSMAYIEEQKCFVMPYNYYLKFSGDGITWIGDTVWQGDVNQAVSKPCYHPKLKRLVCMTSYQNIAIYDFPQEQNNE